MTVYTRLLHRPGRGQGFNGNLPGVVVVPGIQTHARTHARTNARTHARAHTHTGTLQFHITELIQRKLIVLVPVPLCINLCGLLFSVVQICTLYQTWINLESELAIFFIVNNVSTIVVPAQRRTQHTTNLSNIACTNTSCHFIISCANNSVDSTKNGPNDKNALQKTKPLIHCSRNECDVSPHASRASAHASQDSVKTIGNSRR